MDKNIKKWIFNNRNIINITKFIGVSFILLAIVWMVDIEYPIMSKYIPDYLLLSVDVSKDFLSSISAVFLTVTTFTLATILTILTMYDSNYSPRVIQNFIDKPNVLSLIGVFLGGFFYSVLSFYILQNLTDDRRVLAGTLGILYALTSIVYFISFVQIVIRDVNSANLIHDIYTEAKNLIKREVELRKSSERYAEDDISTKEKIYAKETGYLYNIDYEGMISAISDLDCEVVINKKIGEYIPKGICVADMNFDESDNRLNEDNKKDILENIANSFIVNNTKNDKQDYHFEITNMVEIGLRAISPGINDPNTCIKCISKISHLLGQLFKSKNNYIVMKKNENAKIIYISYSVEEELYLTFYQLIHYGKKDPSIAASIVEALYLIYMSSDDSAKSEIKDFYDNTYEILINSMETEMDKKYIEKMNNKFVTERDNFSEEEAESEEE